MERFYVGTDNRDLHTTVLNMTNGDTVEVDPVDLFENALNNCDDEVALDMFDKLIDHLRNNRKTFNKDFNK